MLVYEVWELSRFISERTGIKCTDINLLHAGTLIVSNRSSCNIVILVVKHLGTNEVCSRLALRRVGVGFQREGLGFIQPYNVKIPCPSIYWSGPEVRRLQNFGITGSDSETSSDTISAFTRLEHSCIDYVWWLDANRRRPCLNKVHKPLFSCFRAQITNIQNWSLWPRFLFGDQRPWFVIRWHWLHTHTFLTFLARSPLRWSHVPVMRLRTIFVVLKSGTNFDLCTSTQ